MSKNSIGTLATSSDASFTTTNVALQPPVIPPVTPPVTPHVLPHTPQAPRSNEPQYPTGTVSHIVPRQITRNLKLGDTGEEVRILQQQLNRDGFAVTEGAIFNKATENALKLYQTHYSATGLKSSGILDNTTLLLINAELEKYYNSFNIPDASGTTTGQTSPGGIVDIIFNFISTLIYRIVSGAIGTFNKLRGLVAPHATITRTHSVINNLIHT